MVVGPHPDDFDANGVTLRYMHERGAVMRVVVVRGGSGVEDSYRPPGGDCFVSGTSSRNTGAMPLEVKARIRECEQRESLRFFRLADDVVQFLEMELDEHQQPLENMANRNLLAEAILPFEPDIVMLPHGNDTNQGHRVMFALTRCVLSGAASRTTMLLSRDPKTIGMRTDAYMPFGKEEAEWKAKLLLFHDSQHQRNLNTRGHGFDERILAGNREFARELGIEAEYAEAFEVL